MNILFLHNLLSSVTQIGAKSICTDSKVYANCHLSSSANVNNITSASKDYNTTMTNMNKGSSTQIEQGSKRGPSKSRFFLLAISLIGAVAAKVTAVAIAASAGAAALAATVSAGAATVAATIGAGAAAVGASLSAGAAAVGAGLSAGAATVAATVGAGAAAVSGAMGAGAAGLITTATAAAGTLAGGAATLSTFAGAGAHAIASVASAGFSTAASSASALVSSNIAGMSFNGVAKIVGEKVLSGVADNTSSEPRNEPEDVDFNQSDTRAYDGRYYDDLDKYD